VEATIRVPDGVDVVSVFGPSERHLKMVREALGVQMSARGSTIRISGDRGPVRAAHRVIERIIEAAQRGRALGRREVLDAIAEASWKSDQDQSSTSGPGDAPAILGGDGFESAWTGKLDVYSNGRPIIPRSKNQQYYLDQMFENDLVFGVGPAGTGKTYLAVAAAIHQLKAGRVKRAILARPAVEAGEKLGFLPGDELAKVSPYLRPLIDALHDMLDYTTIKRFMASDVIEIVPLAFMRGRTLNDAIIILDEAQNTTKGQMQMFLTRMGQRSKMIITGDVTQIDLPRPAESGLIDAARRLRRVRGVSFCALEKVDVVRHDLVQRVIEAYAEDEDPDVLNRLSTRRAVELMQEDALPVPDGSAPIDHQGGRADG
jgi:phosphate starvation-inducible protein PhoH and related proteins